MGEPRERPILFSAPMVRAVLEGRKTQTRRVIKPVQPNIDGLWPRGTAPSANDCPYGRTGDRLWVRETWYCDHFAERNYEATRRTYVGRVLTDAECEVEWKGADASLLYYRADGEAHTQFEQLEGNGRIWKPSIHMPRWASRLSLEVTAVRVQRVQDISEDDAKAEGARHFADIPVCRYGTRNRWSMEAPTTTGECLGSARMAFANYLNKLHGGPLWNCSEGPSLWDQNPWVWAVSLRRVEVSR